MNILFLTSRFPTQDNHFTLEKELVFAFNNNGHNCTVANVLEKKYGKKTHVDTLDNGITILNIKTGNLFNDVGNIEKKISALSLPCIFPRSITKLAPNSNFDLIIAYGPYLCGADIVKPLKKYYDAKAILVQWDIFPQNALDLGVIKNKIIFNFLKLKQSKMLSEYDLILCNSQGNKKYLQEHFPSQVNNKLYLFHNCESFTNNINNNLSNQDNAINSDKIKQKYNIPGNSIILIFGGNIGIPQALDNIILLADKLKSNKKIHFVIIGRGTEANKIKLLCEKRNNTTYIDYIPSIDYEALLSVCDYGIISLSEKFTVPNFPAKVTSYLKNEIPIFACLDDAAYNDLGVFIHNNQVGYCIKAKDLISNSEILNINILEELLTNSEKYQAMKINTRQAFDKFFNLDKIFSNLYSKINVLYNK